MMNGLWRCALCLLVLAALLVGSGFRGTFVRADETPVVTHDAQGNEISTTTETTSRQNADGTYSVETVTRVDTKNPAGNVIKKSSKARTVTYKKKGGKQIKIIEGSSTEEFGVDGSHTLTLTELTINNELGSVDESSISVTTTPDGKSTGEKKSTHRGPNGEKSTSRQRLNPDTAKWETIGMSLPQAQPTSALAAAAYDVPLSSDPHYSRANAQPQNGGGTDQDTYLAPLAGPNSEITGTVLGEQAGPTDFYLATVTDTGATQYYHSKTDGRGHFHLRLPQVAGLATLLLFKQFDQDGRPDRGAVCQISDKPVHLENTEPVQSVALSGAAIVEANTAYERGGYGQGIVQLHTRATDALTAKALLDGSDRDIDTMAASDSSLVARLHDDVKLGRHSIGVRSGSQRTNEQPADVVSEQFDPVAPMHSGQVSTVRLHINGLGTDPARVKFTVSGSASLADGSVAAIVPVNNGSCQVDIRARQPGQLIVQTVLLVAIPEIVGKFTPGGLKINVPTPQPPTPTPFPYTTEKPYGTGYQPPPCKPRVDGYFEPSQGVWQDDPKFDDHRTKQIVRPLRAVPNYDAQLDMISFRDTLLFGVEHYRDQNGVKVKAFDHSVIRMSVVSDCSDPPRGVYMRFSLEQGATPPGRLIYASPPLGSIPLTGHHVPEKEYDLFLDSELGVPPPPAPPFRIPSYGNYLIKDELYTDDNKPTGLAVNVGGRIHGTHTVKIAFLAVFLLPASDAEKKSVEDESEQLGIASGKYIPDYYPMQPHSIEAWALDPIDLSVTNVMNPTLERLMYPEFNPEHNITEVRFTRYDRVIAELTRQLDALARLAAYERFVIVLPKTDMEAINPGFGGKAESQKLILIKSGQSFFTVMHELAHTLPYLWSSPQMNRDCSEPGEYHNRPVSWANGVRIDTAGVPGPRMNMDRRDTVMGWNDDDPRHTWITQCTYWNLAAALRKKPDPPALLVRGIVSHQSGRAGAIMWPSYDVNGQIDLQSRPAHSGEHWAVLYEAAGGLVIASFPFEPQWTDENGHQRNLVPFSFQLPRATGLASIALRGPNGFLLRRSVSSQPPSVRVSTPGPVRRNHGTASVALSWVPTVQRGFQQLSTVLYSNDGGASYHQRVFEKPVTAAIIEIDPASSHHRIKVIVTDGNQSTEQTVDLNI